MKLKNIFSLLSGLVLAAGLSGCDGEKDLVIIEGNLPIKTSTLYMVGDATPNGWSIDSPTPLEATGEDPLVFTWEGALNAGEMKLCLTTGSWDVGFIRPVSNGDEIGKEPIEGYTFDMHAGDPDNKWKIKDAGIYSLTFDLRNWTMSSTYLREPEAPEIEPIESDVLYIIGSAAPCDWSIDNPTALEKTADYTFVYEGPLKAGELKACIKTGSWDVPFVRPSSADCRIDKTGVAASDFVFTTAPDNKWKVEEAGIYRLTFDLRNWTIAAEYTGDYTPAAKLYMIGEATDGGWSWDKATEIEETAAGSKIFVWEGELGRGTFKASPEKDFGAPFYRPATADCEVSKSGVASHEMVYTASPDDQWKVTIAGKYRLTFNTAEMTFDAQYVDGTVSKAKLFMIGEATDGGWSLDNATEVEETAPGSKIFVWEGSLKEGTFKASPEKDFNAPFYRPATAGCEVSTTGVASHEMVYTASPDDQWKVTAAGKYRLTFNTAEMTFDAQYLEVAAKPLYMIGTATAGGWSLDDATEFTPVSGKDGQYTWTGHLSEGTFKATLVKDFGAPFYRPATADCQVSKTGVASHEMVHTASPDDQWKVIDAGTYELNLDIKAMTIDVKYIN